jgi:hypothetical protein
MVAGLMFKTTVVGDVDLQHTKERELVCNNASKGVRFAKLQHRRSQVHLKHAA